MKLSFSNGEWCLQACYQLCEDAGIGDEARNADGDTFEYVLRRAGEILGIDIYEEDFIDE